MTTNEFHRKYPTMIGLNQVLSLKMLIYVLEQLEFYVRFSTCASTWSSYLIVVFGLKIHSLNGFI